MRAARAFNFVMLFAFSLSAKGFAQTAGWVYANANNSNSVTLYHASSAGQMTKVGKYPLNSNSVLIGGTASHLFAAGQPVANGTLASIDTYPLKTNGAVGLRSATIDVRDYMGPSCPEPGSGGVIVFSAKLDHSGHYLFVHAVNEGTSESCAQWQTYQIASNGALTFLGREEALPYGNVDTISSSNVFAYGTVEGCAQTDTAHFDAFSRASDHVLSVNYNFTHKDPVSMPTTTTTLHASSDPTDHLAVLMEDCSKGLPARLASYTINTTTGSIASSNTWGDMPATLVDTQNAKNSLPPMNTSMSPSGKMLVVWGGGFQVFHFNGASHLTKFTGLLLGTEPIGPVGWDKYNHLYVLDRAGQIFVYTVTPTSFSAVSGSPFSASGNSNMVVISR